EVPTQCGRWRRGGLEVDTRSPDGPAERGARDRLGDDVDREPVGIALDNGEAGSGHVDAGVDPQVRRHPRGCDLEPQARGVWPRMADGPDLLDDPGEHLASVPSNARSSPSLRTRTSVRSLALGTPS